MLMQVSPDRVWLLGASTGRLPAVKQFLSVVPVGKEIAFIYLQHKDNQQVDILLRMIETKTEWPARHGNTRQLIETGTVTLVFLQYETRLCKWGLILRFDSPWQGQYARPLY